MLDTKELLEALSQSLIIIKRHYDSEGEKSAAFYLRRLQYQWLHDRPLPLHADN